MTLLPPAPGLPLAPFPWDRLAPARDRARTHPDGLVDLSVGTPVDPVPGAVQAALAAAADSPGYPTALGTPAVREAAAAWMERRLGVRVDPATEVLPSTGSKEVVGLLPWLLGARPGDRVLHPALAYPTYDVGARLAGATPEPVEDVTSADPAGAVLVWLNSPSNPTGRVMRLEELRAAVAWAREHDVVLASDECYVELGWEGPAPVSVLHPDVCGGSTDGLLAVHSLSKRSNLAGYRAGVVAGDRAVVARLLELRRQAGLLVPAPVQAAAAAAFADDAEAAAQKARYAARRDVLLAGLRAAGFVVEHSEAGLYLWASRPGESAEQLVDALADRGVLVAPGDIYGPAGAGHVRVALTAPDERVAAAAARLRDG